MRKLILSLFLVLPLAAQDVRPVATPEQVLAEVNARRATRGLPPYQLDPALAQGATACAIHRAQRGIQGHTANDFAFLPPGTRASSAGCAAWPTHLGWGSCSIYENARYAGAGFCQVGNIRYMHLFVR